MRPDRPFQDLLALLFAGLVAWAFVQLSGPFPVPVGLTAAAGVVAAAGLLAWRARERAAAEPPAAGHPPLYPFELTGRQAVGLVIGLVLVSLALRFHALLDRPAWEDEMWTLRNFYTDDWGDLLRIAFDDYWPPLHYLILNTVTRIADTSLVWLRSPSVLFGTATIAVAYPLGKELLGSRMAAVMSTALLAGMTSHVLYSQETRVYAMHVFLAVLSATYFYRSFWERRISLGFLLSTTLLTYSHSFASWYFIAGQCAYVALAWLIWRDGEQFRKGFLSQLAVLLLWMPLVGAFAYSRLAREIVVPTYWATGPETPLGLFDVVEQYQSLAVRSWAGAAFMALLFALALVPLLRREPEPDRAEAGDGPDRRTRYVRALLFLLCWVTVPLAFSFVVSAATTLDTFGATRYHLTVLPGLCLLAVAGVAVVRSRATLTAVALLLVLLPAAQLQRHYRDFAVDRSAMDEAAAIVREHERPGELIFVGNGFRAFAYYHRGVFPRIGSEQWDSLTAAHAHLTDVYTMESTKRGDTYAHEKFSPRIQYFGWYRSVPDPAVRFVREHQAQGDFEGSYWLVLLADGDRLFRQAYTDAGLRCTGAATWRVPGLEIIHCGAEEGEGGEALDLTSGSP